MSGSEAILPDPLQEVMPAPRESSCTSVPVVSARLQRLRRQPTEGTGFLYFIFGALGGTGVLLLWTTSRFIARALLI